MSDEGLGLQITDDHILTIESLRESPVSFQVKDTSNLPPEWMSDIQPRNQGSFSCCVGGGLSGCFEHRNLVETGEFIRRSMWQAYIAAQEASGMLGRDSGASLAGALTAAGKVGVSIDSLCPMPQGYTTRIPQEALKNAAAHKHLGDARYDCRNWGRMIDWITNKDPVLFGGIWTSALDGVCSTDWVIQPRHLKTGTRRGYHCEYLCGWTTLDGEIVPFIRNTHGAKHGRNGVAVISREAWDIYVQDPYFVALAFGDVQEIAPKRRDLSQVSYLSGKTKSIV